jgi:hypothetical protein
MPESDWMTDTRTSYDTVAASYSGLLRDSLDEQPVVRHVLALFAGMVHGAGGGPVAERRYACCTTWTRRWPAGC